MRLEPGQVTGVEFDVAVPGHRPAIVPRLQPTLDANIGRCLPFASQCPAQTMERPPTNPNSGLTSRNCTIVR